jgi:hypothetical protein
MMTGSKWFTIKTEREEQLTSAKRKDTMEIRMTRITGLTENEVHWENGKKQEE